MQELKFLSPAELLAIVNPSNSNLSELLRVTLLDLQRRDILILEKKRIKIKSTGKDLLKHELIVLKHLKEDSFISISEFSKHLKKTLKSGDNYLLKYVTVNRLSDYFSSNILQKILGIKQLSKNGLKVQQELLVKIDGAIKELRDPSKNYEHSIFQALKEFGHNSVILSNLRAAKRPFPKKVKKVFYESYLGFYGNSEGASLNIIGFINGMKTTDSESAFSFAADDPSDSGSNRKDGVNDFGDVSFNDDIGGFGGSDGD
ncbi:MAG: hypothetical protein KTR26_21120 [Flammeovirgaceae bacterium]|nr:hypothetical protein [Flammeovirgaceae bacterium]